MLSSFWSSEEIGFPPISFDGYRVVRRCVKYLHGQRMWHGSGRHLSRTKLGLATRCGRRQVFLPHAGVIQVLQSAGYTIDYVAGSSMGGGGRGSGWALGMAGL